MNDRTRKVQLAEFISHDDDITDVEFSTDLGGSGNQTDHDKKLDDLLDDLNNDENAVVSVYRQTGDGKTSMSFLTSFPPDKYTPDQLRAYLRDNYGTGDYRIHVRVNGRVRANRLISVEAPKTTETLSGAESSSELVQVMKLMMARQDQMFQAISTQQAPTRKEMLDELLTYKQLFEGNSAPRVDPIQQLESTVSLLTGLGLEIGGKSEDDGFGELINKLSPLMEYALNPVNKPQPQPQPDHTQQKKQAGINMQKIAQNIKLKMGVTMLVGLAKRKNDVEESAKLVLDQVTPNDLNMLLNSGDYVANLATINPDVENYREWFTMLGNKLKEMIPDNGTNTI